MKAIDVKRTSVRLRPDPARVLMRPFNLTTDPERARRICERVKALSEREVRAILDEVLAEFGERHLKTREFLKRRYEQVRPHGAAGVGGR